MTRSAMIYAANSETAYNSLLCIADKVFFIVFGNSVDTFVTYSICVLSFDHKTGWHNYIQSKKTDP